MRGQPLPVPRASLDSRVAALEAAASAPPVLAGSVRLTAQGAAIASTSITPTLRPGLYRAAASVRVTTAGTAGTVSLALAWTDDAQAETATLVSLLALTAKGQASGTALLRVASGTVAYSTSIAGVGVGHAYAVDVALERMGD